MPRLEVVVQGKGDEEEEAAGVALFVMQGLKIEHFRELQDLLYPRGPQPPQLAAPDEDEELDYVGLEQMRVERKARDEWYRETLEKRAAARRWR